MSKEIEQNRVKQQIDRRKERFIKDEIDKEMFAKYKQKMMLESQQIEIEMAKSTNRVSNLEKCIEMAIQFSAKLPSMWGLDEYESKQKLQYLLFPQGIVYDKKSDHSRTTSVNAVFGYIAAISSLSDKK